MVKRRSPAAAIALVAVLLLGLTAVLVFLVFGFRFKSGEKSKFIGKSENGQPVEGTINYADGSSATLDYYNHTITYSNGDVYVGDIVGLERHGNGKMTYAATGDIYEGDFKNDELNGTGVFSYANGDKYEGEMQDSKKNGHGKFTFVSGSSYEGGFENDAKSGYGVFIWTDGSRYEGYFKDDVKNGYGSMIFAGGDKYEGNFENDMRSGTGLYTWKDGTSYSGTFRRNLMDTRLVDADGNFITDEKGNYKHGEMAYYTTITETGKTNYIGYFQEGKIVPVNP